MIPTSHQSLDRRRNLHLSHLSPVTFLKKETDDIVSSLQSLSEKPLHPYAAMGMINHQYPYAESAFRRHRPVSSVHQSLLNYHPNLFNMPESGMASLRARLHLAGLESKVVADSYNLGRERMLDPLLSARLSMMPHPQPPLHIFANSRSLQPVESELVWKKKVEEEALMVHAFNIKCDRSLDPLLSARLSMMSHPQALHLFPDDGRAQAGDSEESKKKKNEEEALTFMGSTSRNQKKGMYFDASVLADPDPLSTSNRRPKGGVTEPFPEKVHRMLSEAEENGNEDIASFFPHGRAFAIHKPEKFVRDILPIYFRQSRMSSFQRQLNLYGFTRIASGPDEGGYYHELFLKERPGLCVHMQRVGVPHGPGSDGSGRRGPRGPTHADPDFYAMAAITKFPSGHTQSRNVSEKQFRNYATFPHKPC
jgi:hypothetical protein